MGKLREVSQPAWLFVCLSQGRGHVVPRTAGASHPIPGLRRRHAGKAHAGQSPHHHHHTRTHTHRPTPPVHAPAAPPPAGARRGVPDARVQRRADLRRGQRQVCLHQGPLQGPQGGSRVLHVYFQGTAMVRVRVCGGVRGAGKYILEQVRSGFHTWPDARARLCPSTEAQAGGQGQGKGGARGLSEAAPRRGRAQAPQGPGAGGRGAGALGRGHRSRRSRSAGRPTASQAASQAA